MITLHWRPVYTKECGEKAEECIEIKGSNFNDIFPKYSQKLESLSAKTIVVSDFLGLIDEENAVVEDSLAESNT